VRRILEELPETLDETYERILQEIPKPNREHAVRLLQCLAVVVRPLRVEELADVLAVDFSAAGGIPKLNEDLRWEDQEQAVLSACSSLITIVKDRDSRIVQFSHFSVKEFLTSGRLAASNANALCYYHIRLESAHTIMAKACLGVLLRLDGHSDDFIYDHSYNRVKEFPLARYAADHFGDHAEFGNVISHIEDGIDELLDAEKPYLAEWLWIRRNDSLWSHKPQAVPLYYVAEFGFCGLAQHLISTRPQDLDTLSRSSGNPLHAAVYNEQVEVLRLLIGHCEDVNVRGPRNWTPLHLAVSRGSFEIMRILVDRGADINSLDEKGQSPLHRILDPMDHSYKGWYPDPYFEPVSSEACIIDDHSLDEAWYPDPYDCWYPDLCEDPYLDQVSFLLEQGGDVDAQDNYYLSPLHIASSRGMPKVVKLLLEHGASVHVRNNQGQTPLHRSLGEPDFMFQARYFDVIRLLLAHGVDVDAQDNNCSTPLHMASCVRSLRAVLMLLGHGANVHARNNHGETPLHEAMTRRVHKPRDEHFDVIRLLLAHSADLDAQDNEGSTPLHIASYKGTFKDVQILLERGANVHSKSRDKPPYTKQSESREAHIRGQIF
jgi:ankyrin repeat protein